MTTLPIYSTPLKRDLIQRAYSYCGLGHTDYDLSPEEYVIGLRAMNDQMAVLGPSTGYNFPNSGDGDPADDSGIAASDILGASVYVAQLLAPMIGKTLTVKAVQARAASSFLARHQPVPMMEMGRQTIRGAGNKRRFSGQSPFFLTDVSPDEIIQ